MNNPALLTTATHAPIPFSQLLHKPWGVRTVVAWKKEISPEFAYKREEVVHKEGRYRSCLLQDKTPYFVGKNCVDTFPIHNGCILVFFWVFVRGNNGCLLRVIPRITHIEGETIGLGNPRNLDQMSTKCQRPLCRIVFVPPSAFVLPVAFGLLIRISWKPLFPTMNSFRTGLRLIWSVSILSIVELHVEEPHNSKVQNTKTPFRSQSTSSRKHHWIAMALYYG